MMRTAYVDWRWMELCKVMASTELMITDDIAEKFDAMSDEEKREYIIDNGKVVIDDFMINDGEYDDEVQEYDS